MEDIIAVAVLDDAGTKYYFLTWGRVFDRIDGSEVVGCVKRYARGCDLKNVKKAYLCNTLKEASGQMYFHEALFRMAQKRIPFGKTYESWRKKMGSQMKKGQEIYYLGRPKPKWAEIPKKYY